RWWSTCGRGCSPSAANFSRSSRRFAEGCSARAKRSVEVGILDLFGGSREKREAKRIRDLTKRSQEKYGDPALRSRALEGLRDIGTPEAISALLQRFTARTEPGITDTEEKEYTLEILQSFGEKAVEPVVAFLEQSESGVSWGVRCLQG